MARRPDSGGCISLLELTDAGAARPRISGCAGTDWERRIFKLRSAPGISIVITNYNYGRFLEQAIRSALDQSLPAGLTELIIVDDGSTDRSRGIIKKYEWAAKCVYKENGGQASAMNAGFRQASGELVWFLDSDDYLHPVACEKVLKAYKALSHAERQRVSRIEGRLHVRFDDEQAIKKGRVLPRRFPQDPRAEFLGYGRCPGPTTSGNVWPSPFLRKIFPIPEGDFKWGADSYLYVNAAFLGKPLRILDAVGVYRKHNMAKTYFSVPFIKNQLQTDRTKEACITELARSTGFPDRFGPSRWARNGPHMRLELFARKLGLSDGFFQETGFLRLLLTAVKAVALYRPYPLAARLFYMLEAACLAAVPKGAIGGFVSLSAQMGPVGNFRRMARDLFFSSGAGTAPGKGQE